MARFGWKSREDLRTKEREEALAHLRTRRNEALAASDWTQLPDAPLTPEERAAWAKYRRSLRSLPDAVTPEQTAKDVRSISLPTRPATPAKGRNEDERR